MKRYTWIILLAVALMALAGCASSTVEASEPTPTAMPSIGLAGTSWVLSSLGGDLPMPGVAITLDFGADGALSGSDGCNNFNMGYVQDGSSLTIAQPGASTMMACEADVMNQAAALMSALARTTSFTANARQLVLQDGNEILATFVSASQTLVDSAWEVTAYNNGSEAVVGLLPGSEIVVNIGADGSLTGNAGCNNFVTSFAAVDGTVAVAPIGTTFRMCDNPAGVMEQEAQFLAALAAGTTYSIRGNDSGNTRRQRPDAWSS